ncbi:Calcium/calmodulin-dependent protein kinase kinase 1 [Ceratocystis platani]|uniref:Calcium/calmodulin-dependent protein kinase kinase 1 n=1 Tax=Ceratocystis fimbriata f. sp. platani TaxID=88771 RepID=A0A0F8AXB5_CERFI|nr:Calcium/calmodulin-dependent protein kinase kinase 1 [Ceratocystis platani]
MKKLHHENLVQLIEVLDDPEEDSLYMVLEMCQRGVVQSFGENKRAEPLDEEKARHYFRDLILGIEYLHSQCIIHRDIKPENLLLSEDDVLKISDFGVSQMFTDVRNEDMKISKDAGSPAFMAPELCRPKHGDVAGKAVDIWAMGVTLYCFRYGKIPFEEGDNPFDMYDNIRMKRHVLPEGESPEFVDLMDRILDKDPLTRIKMPELREHPWVTMSGVDPLLPEEENCAEFIDVPNELELSQALTRRTTNIFTVMKVLSKLKSRVARRKALMSKSLQEPLSPVTQANLSESNAQLAAELARRRQHYKANKKRPSFLDLPVEDDLASPGSSSPHSDGPKPAVPFIRYLGIGTGSQYHVPKNDEDNDYVAESPTSINFSFSDPEGTHQYKSRVLSESPKHTNTSSDWEDKELCEHTMALRVDSGYGEISGGLEKKTNERMDLRRE